MRATGSLGRECLRWECGSPRSTSTPSSPTVTSGALMENWGYGRVRILGIRELIQQRRGRYCERKFVMAASTIPLGGVNRYG